MRRARAAIQNGPQGAQQGQETALGADLAVIGGKTATATSEPLGAILDAMPERAFQNGHVVDGLRSRGFVVWTVPDMRKTRAGLPDVLAWSPLQPGALLAWEMKTTRGKASEDQIRALTHLSTVIGVDARIVRPRDWAALRDVIDYADPGVLIDMLTAIPRGF